MVKRIRKGFVIARTHVWTPRFHPCGRSVGRSAAGHLSRPAAKAAGLQVLPARQKHESSLRKDTQTARMALQLQLAGRFGGVEKTPVAGQRIPSREFARGLAAVPPGRPRPSPVASPTR
jgi:hypothetical protein